MAGVRRGQVRRHCSLAPPSGHEESKSMAPSQAHLSSVEIRLMWHCCLYHFLLWRPFNHLKLRPAEVQNHRQERPSKVVPVSPAKPLQESALRSESGVCKSRSGGWECY